MATPNEALAKLRSDPGSFLKNYYVKIVRTMNVSGVTAYWFGGTGFIMDGKTIYDRTARPDGVLGNLLKHDSKNFKFSPLRGDVIGSPVQLSAWHVDVTGSNTIQHNRIPALHVSRTGGPDIVLTTLLNGCTFVCEPGGHSVLMSHVQPVGTTGAVLETAIMNRYVLNGGQERVGEAFAFGAGRCYVSESNDVTIIGVRSQQQWRLFAQIHPRNQKQTARVVEFFNG